jgi:hypothetical protein
VTELANIDLEAMIELKAAVEETVFFTSSFWSMDFWT